MEKWPEPGRDLSDILYSDKHFRINCPKTFCLEVILFCPTFSDRTASSTGADTTFRKNLEGGRRADNDAAAAILGEAAVVETDTPA